MSHGSGGPWRRGAGAVGNASAAAVASNASRARGDSNSAGAVAGSPEGAGGGGGSASESLSKVQQQELRAFSEALTAAERDGGYAAAIQAFESKANELRPAQLWRVHFELAECAKRGADLTHVKHHVAQALLAQPMVAQVWLEACRTFEEVGEPAECRRLLEHGLLSNAAPNDQLAPKLIRVLERQGDNDAMRALMGSLRGDPLDRISKVIIEAAHYEVRAGSGELVRALMRCLLLRIPNQGPIYCEVIRIETILGHTRSALILAERGVQTCPKYGPLWFVLVRLAEKVYGASAVKDYANYALQNVCHELHWKFHFEVAAAFSREGGISQCRKSICASVKSCPKHLRWKVWLLAARSELWDGTVATSRKLLSRARTDAPARVQAAVCIERARMEEYAGDLAFSRAALDEAHTCEAHDWKVFLERISMEARQGFLDEARAAAVSALNLHPATGRLWSALIALEHSRGDVEAARTTFRRAVREVPKSGEVWCEGARVFLNPLGSYFSLSRARKCLEFAVHLTPQYGDSFLELLRLRFLYAIAARMREDPIVLGLYGSTSQPPEASEDGVDSRNHDGFLAARGQRLGVAALVAQRVCMAIAGELQAGRFNFGVCLDDVLAQHSATDSNVNRSAGSLEDLPRIRLSQLELLCNYADPNYGFLWFWCRQSSLSTPREVLQQMRLTLVEDLLAGGTLWAYAWAVARGVLNAATGSRSEDGGDEAPATDARSDGVDIGADRRDKTENSLAARTDGDGLNVSDFAVGSLQLARCFATGTHSLTQPRRQRLIFGSDILCV